MIITVQDCKNFRDLKDENTGDDEELESIIVAVQSFLETECGRKFELDATNDLVEYYSGCHWHTQLLVAKPPIVSITDIQIDNLRVWDKPVLDAALYAVYDADSGIIKLLQGLEFTDGTLNIRIRYKGGYSAASMPADLKRAAIEMVWAARMKGSSNLVGVRSRSLGDGSVQYVNLDWPLNLGAIVNKYNLRSMI